MTKELTTVEPLEGEYIAAGEEEHNYTATDSMEELAKREAAAMQQMHLNRMQAAAQRKAAGMGDMRGGGLGARQGLAGLGV